MTNSLQPVWAQIEKYIDAGISIIPVRDKTDESGIAKAPFGRSWKEFQSRIIAKEELFEAMEKYNTTAIGIVGGKVSGNLEIIDIDIKYKVGIDATFFKDLKDLYPQIFEKVRIHKSPSGGFHVLYRCNEAIEGNQKLAGREKTEEELKEQPRPSTVNFLETRGEGGYVVGPPGLGYSIVKENPIPVLSKVERDAIITLCQSYNEIVKAELAPYKPSKTESDFYDLNPFDDFNLRCDPSSLVAEFGWQEFKHSNKFIWYSRPGKKKGVSMSFNREKRFYFCFTASTELEESKGYTPANLLAVLAHNGDKKSLYQDLVKRGYGSIKLKVEEKLVRQAAINNKPLPGNISKRSADELVSTIAELKEKHPFGIFWMESEKNGVQIDRELLYRVAAALGFFIWHGKIIKGDGSYIEEVSDRDFYDQLKSYIKEEDADFYKDICNAYEGYIEKHGKFTITRLPLLNDDLVLSDTKDACFKCYQNGILKITATKAELLPSTDKLIWKHSLYERPFRGFSGGKYVEFLKLALKYEPTDEYLLGCIGYLAHEYKDETAAYIVVLTEECENPQDGGGAGKNVFSNLFRFITSFTNKPGEQTKMDEKFMQSWNYQKIFCISDAPRNFNFGFLKELSAGEGLMKKLFKDEVSVPSHLMPKFLVQTNYSVEIKDGGLKRRIKIIEFTDFFTLAGGLDVHFNAHFPNEWTEDDWAGFDTLMAKAVQVFLKNNRKIGQSIMSTGGWLKQFRQTYGDVTNGIVTEYIDSWVAKGYVSNDDFKQDIERYFSEANTPPHYRPSMNKINAAVAEWCKKHDLQYMNQLQFWDSFKMASSKRKWFGLADAVPY